MTARTKRVAVLALGLSGLALACDERNPQNPLSVSVTAHRVGGDGEREERTRLRMRWDLVNVLSGGAAAGGTASSKSLDGARITLTGSGTFVAGGEARSSDVTGGGTWTITAGSATSAGNGSYRVTGLVRWEPVPGTLPIPDQIGDAADARAGFAILRIRYSDGSGGILVVGCRLAGSPGSVLEGITVSKGFVDFWNHEEPAAGAEGNRTLFHVVRGRRH